jgi:hypothetical protein
LAFALVPDATETAWFHALAKTAQAICFFRERIAFVDETGMPIKGNPRGSTLFLFGAPPDIVARFHRTMAAYGWTYGPVLTR